MRVNETFWRLFSEDYRVNCLAWHHSPRNPVIPASGDAWKSFWTANPDTLDVGGRRFLYYRGNGILPGTDGKRHDRIAVAEILDATSEAIEFRDLNDGLPIVDVGAPGAFDCRHVLDPAAIIFQDRVWLYYSAVGEGPDSVGLACSSDGVHFDKVGQVLEGRAPDLALKDGRLFMLYQQKSQEGTHEFFLAGSDDGIHFVKEGGFPIFSPSGRGNWDGYDICTGRLHAAHDAYYLIYGGSSSLLDQPDYFGLARSNDLLHWERHPGNPIFGCGAKGQEDGGAIWFPALIETADRFVLLYEGSRGNYRGDLSSQICQSSIPKKPLGRMPGQQP